MEPSWGQEGAKRGQEGPKWSPDEAKMRPSGAKMGPRAAKIRPRWDQNGAKMEPTWRQNGVPENLEKRIPRNPPDMGRKKCIPYTTVCIRGS